MYVIVDQPRSPEEMPAFVKKDLIEGWIFTWYLSSATKFDTEEQARNVIKEHYPNNNPPLQVCKREEYHE